MRTRLERGDVSGHAVDAERLHASLDAADQRAVLVVGKIVSDGAAQDCCDLVQILRPSLGAAMRMSPSGRRFERLQVLDQLGWHGIGCADMIDEPGRDCAHRHAGKSGLIVLGLRHR